MLSNKGLLLLGLHSYTFHHFGYCGTWGGQEPQRLVWGSLGLLDKAGELGLAGVQVTAVDLELDVVEDPWEHLARVKQKAAGLGLWLEFNFSLDAAGYDLRMERTVDQALDIASAIGAEIAKITTDIKRPRPLFGGKFHPEVRPRLADLVETLKAPADEAGRRGIYLAVENHQDLFAEELLWVLDRVNHPYVKACLDPTNGIPLGENPNTVTDLLAPVAVTNHITDYGYVPEHWGIRLVGGVIGAGDVDIVRTLQVIKDVSPTRRIHLEVELDPGTDDLDRARAAEWRAAVDSVTNLRQIITNLT